VLHLRCRPAGREEAPLNDELYRDVQWTHVVHLPVLGIPTTFATNSADAHEIVQEAFGNWAALAGRPDLPTTAKPVVRIVVHKSSDLAPAAPVFTYRVPDPTRMLIMSETNMGVADTMRLDSVAYVAASLLSRREEFVEGILEPLVFFLLGQLDRQPLHAAAIARGDVALVLTGPSGAGKSTLTYAAWRHGLAPLGDEPIHVQMRPALRVWGRRSRIHLPVEARTHFPELESIAPRRFLSGKSKLVITGSDGAGPQYADRVGICLLRPDAGGAPRLERISASRMAAELTARREPGYDLYASTIGERVARIAERGAWVLRGRAEPADVLPLLDRMIAELEA
jgi:hypothetical protein